MLAAVFFGATLVAQGPWYFESTGWTSKTYEWKGWGQTPKLSETDWSGYDRLSVDLVNEGEGGDRLYMFIGSPQTPHDERRLYHTATPDHRFKRWVVPLNGFKPSMSVSNVTHLAFSSRKGRTQKLHISNIRLLRKGEASGGGTFTEAPSDRPDLRDQIARTVAVANTARAERHAAALERFAADCAAAGATASGVMFGQASPMVRVMPREAFSAKPATNLYVRLARNEKEAIQLLVAPTTTALKNVKVTVSDLAHERPFWKVWGRSTSFAASNVAAQVVGYVDMKVMPDYSEVYTMRTASNTLERVRRPPRPGWYPDLLLDFLDAVNIAKGDVQSFWLNVRCPDNQPAGIYRGCVTVTADGLNPVVFPLTVRVNDFTLPKTPPVPMNISFKPTTWGPSMKADLIEDDYFENEDAIERDSQNAAHLARANTWAWADFLADHLITIDFLYPSVGPRWDALVRLKNEGRLDCFNLKYWNDRSNKDSWFKEARKVYEKAKKLGLLDHAVFYGMDELTEERFEAGARMIARLKHEFPDVRLATTCKDPTYGCGSPLRQMDIFIPVTVSYIPTNCVKARAEGRKVGWYVCAGGDFTVPNFFFARQLIESRLLMGATAVKYRPDWFLYYQITLWAHNRPITSGPFTDWSPEAYRAWSGDGSLVACGPGGKPLSTLRLENFRDGLEDFHYAKILEARGGTADIPDSIVTNLHAHTDDPDAYQAWRDALADAIERLSAP